MRKAGERVVAKTTKSQFIRMIDRLITDSPLS